MRDPRKISRLAIMTGSMVLLFIAASVAQQNLVLPQPSPYAEVTQEIGLSLIKITYHRPAVNNRAIWGELVPYDRVWRAGANENTVMEFSDPVKIGTTEIPAGKYGFHIIPGKDQWTLILTSVSVAWGSFTYDQAEDVMRLTVKPEPAEMCENLLYYFDNVTGNSADIVLHWEKMRIRMPVAFDVPQLVLQNIRGQLRSLPRFSWQGWNQAANFCLQNDINLDEALQWVERSIRMNRNFNNLRTRSALLLKLNRKEEADQVMKEALDIATEIELNAYGYQKLFNNDIDGAIEIFVMNTKRFPDSWNVFDSLGEAYQKKGNTKLALTNYNKAFDMVQDPEQKKRIEDVLKQLKDQ